MQQGLALLGYYPFDAAAAAIWHVHGRCVGERGMNAPFFGLPFEPSRLGARNVPRFGDDVYPPGFDD